MEYLTAQQIFDKVATHLLTQKQKSRSENGDSCFYRGVDNTMCAVGCLIPDELYSKTMEYRTVNNTNFRKLRLDKAGIDIKHVTLLTRLQEIHDSQDVSSWKVDLQKLASNNNLDSKVLDNFPNWNPDKEICT